MCLPRKRASRKFTSNKRMSKPDAAKRVRRGMALLVVAGAILPVCIRPAAAQARFRSAQAGSALGRQASCQAQAGEAGTAERPQKAFRRLLYRLDHAPIDLDAMEAHARRGSQMSQMGMTFAAAIAPVLPLLDRAAHSPTLGLIARLPVIGSSCAVAQQCLGAGKELGTGFTNLVTLDRKHIEPVRQAIQKTNALRRSRSPSDVAAAVDALDAASAPLQAYELASVKQRQGIAGLMAMLQGLDALMKARQAATTPAVSKQPSALSPAIQSLQKLNMALVMQTLAVHQLRQYVEDCAGDGHQALTER